MPWIPVVPVDKLPVGEAAALRHEDRAVAVFHRPDGLYAIDNFCPHRGALLHEGGVFEGTVICPWHQWQFELKTGKCLTIPSACVAVHPVKVEDGQVWVELL
jgi:NAD(P)H-dependent nitrite reductase small subunit